MLRAGQTVAFGLKSLINAVLAPENILGARVKLRLCVSAMISTQETVAEKVIALNTERKKKFPKQSQLPDTGDLKAISLFLLKRKKKKSEEMDQQELRDGQSAHKSNQLSLPGTRNRVSPTV